MSQAELAAGLVTAPYISLIERGHKVPSDALQRQLLARLGVDAPAEAADRDLFMKVCAATELRDASAARELMARAPDTTSSSAHRRLAQALTDMLSGFFSDASQTLVGLFNAFPAGSIEQLWVVRGACAAAIRLGRFDAALTIARPVLAIESPTQTAEMDHLRSVIRASSASMLSLRGDYTDALELCRQGLAAANSPWAAASALWVQAMTYERMDKPELAAMSAREALVHVQTANRPHDQAALQHLAAWLEMRSGDYDPTVIDVRLTEAESVLKSLHATDELGALKATRAELIARTEGVLQALPLFEEALTLIDPENRVRKARELTVMGILLSEQGHTDAAVDALHRALAELSLTDTHADSARTWHRLGQAYEDVGLVPAALHCMKQATAHLGLKNPSDSESSVRS